MKGPISVLSLSSPVRINKTVCFLIITPVEEKFTFRSIIITNSVPALPPSHFLKFLQGVQSLGVGVVLIFPSHSTSRTFIPFRFVPFLSILRSFFLFFIFLPSFSREDIEWVTCSLLCSLLSITEVQSLVCWKARHTFAGVEWHGNMPCFKFSSGRMFSYAL